MAPFNLNYFKRITSNKQYNVWHRCNVAYNYAEKRLKKIGQGADRAVFRLDKTSVLKITIDNIFQNEREVLVCKEYKNRRRILTKVKDYNKDFIWIISEYAEPIKSNQRMAKADKSSLKAFGAFKFGESFYADGIEISDVCWRNLGIYRGKLVFVDYGWD